MTMRWRRFTISKCPHDVYLISIDDESGGGISLTANKCCGRWEVIYEFPMTAKALRDAATELECNADQLEREED